MFFLFSSLVCNPSLFKRNNILRQTLISRWPGPAWRPLLLHSQNSNQTNESEAEAWLTKLQFKYRWVCQPRLVFIFSKFKACNSGTTIYGIVSGQISKLNWGSCGSASTVQNNRGPRAQIYQRMQIGRQFRK